MIGGKKFAREIVRKPNAAAFLVYDPIRDAIVLVLQVREPMRSKKNRKGVTVEVPAGHVKGKNTRAEIAREASEEIGATIPEEQVLLLNQGQMLAVSPGWTTERVALATIELKPGQIDRAREKFGLAKEGEYITRRFVPVSDLETMVLEDLKTYALVQWFLKERAKKRIHELQEDLHAMHRMDDRS